MKHDRKFWIKTVGVNGCHRFEAVKLGPKVNSVFGNRQTRKSGRDLETQKNTKVKSAIGELKWKNCGKEIK